MKIIVHLGAHKTATTHLQNVLQKAESTLKGSGIYYWSLDDFRAKITKQIDWNRSHSPGFFKRIFFPGECPNRNPFSMFADTVDKISREHGKIIISDENLLGGAKAIYDTNQIYGKNANRIFFIRKLFRKYDVQFFLSIRNPATFLPSIYCESLSWMKFRPFEEIFQKKPLHELSWLPLISVLRDGLPGQKLTIWDYEVYRNDKQFIIDQLTGEDLSNWDLLEDQEPKARFSAKAVDLISHGSFKNYDEKYWRKKVNEIVVANPVSASNPKYQPFTTEMVKQLTLGYKRDLKKIEKMPGVVLLKEVERTGQQK